MTLEFTNKEYILLIKNSVIISLTVMLVSSSECFLNYSSYKHELVDPNCFNLFEIK